MPQLEFWHFLPQFFWLAVCFATLYLVMAFFALPRIGRVLADRKARIDRDLDAAEKARARAEAVHDAHESSLAAAREKARKAIADAVGASRREAEERERELDGAIARQVDDAQRRIAAERQRVMGELSDAVAPLVQAAAARLIGVEVDSGEAARAVAALGKEQP